MSRPSAARGLTLTEELEKLEQSITLTLQEIDHNFSKAHRIVTGSILPLVEQYAAHSNGVWEGSKFWKQFFEASANVSLAGYEEAEAEAEEEEEQEDVTETTETTTTTMADSTTGDEAHDRVNEEEEEEGYSALDSPTQVTGVHSTPRLKSSAVKPRTAFMSPSPRKYTGKKQQKQRVSEPSTPRAQAQFPAQSSPFEPQSAYQASAQQQNNDVLLHRVLDKNYRVQGMYERIGYEDSIMQH